jgi:hypothetical protein
MSKKVVIGIIIVIILALIVYWVYKVNKPVVPPSTTGIPQSPTTLQNQQTPTRISAEPQTTPEEDLQALDNLDKEYDSGFNQEMQNMDTEINKL